MPQQSEQVIVWLDVMDIGVELLETEVTGLDDRLVGEGALEADGWLLMGRVEEYWLDSSEVVKVDG